MFRRGTLTGELLAGACSCTEVAQLTLEADILMPSIVRAACS